MLKRKVICLILAVMLLGTMFQTNLFTPVAYAANVKPNVVPALREWTGGDGNFTLTQNSRICVDPTYTTELTEKANVFKEDLLLVSGVNASVVNTASPSTGDFFLTLSCTDTGIGNEGYLFEVSSYVTIRGNAANGVFYGTRTALQILTQDTGKAVIPKGTARDYPKYSKRGFMLDVARKYFTPEFIEDYVKFMSWFKMNDFHIHWTDSWGSYQAFRLESTTYPTLTALDGSYSKAWVNSLEALAKKYNVTIIPEFDTPSHSGPFTTIRPDLKDSGDTSGNTLDLSNPNTLPFMKTIYDEYCQLFDASVFHIGCDEYDGSGGNELLNQYINELNSYITGKGKSTRIWNGYSTSVTTQPNTSVTIDCWTPWDGVLAEAQKGHKVVNSSYPYTYIVPLKGWQGDFKSIYETWDVTKISSTGSFSPTDTQLLGAKLNIWLDEMRNSVSEGDCDYQIQPHMKIIAEANWSGRQSATYEEFLNRTALVGNAPGTNLLPGGKNLAYKKTATASSSYGSNTPNKAFDSSYTSRWESTYSDSQWITVDLGQSCEINRVALEWENAQGKNYKIQVSSDNVNWTDVATVTNHPTNSKLDNLSFNMVNARYVRMLGTARATTWGYSLYDFSVYGEEPAFIPTEVNLALNKTVVVSNEETTNFTAKNAVDGKTSTRWSTVWSDPQWIYVNLGSPTSINRVKLNWEAAYGKSYKIQVSNDAVTWTDVYSTTSGDGGTDDITFNSTTSQYVRMYGLQRGTGYGYSLYEFEVYGNARYLSEMNWTSTTNGWGPVEKNTSNGEAAAGDGGTITLNGVTYAKGLGAHANSTIIYNIANLGYTRFQANVGVDDEVTSSSASIVFQVWLDGVKVFDSGTMGATSATKAVDVSVTGGSELKLVITDAGNGNGSDHGDWAIAKLIK